MSEEKNESTKPKGKIIHRFTRGTEEHEHDLVKLTVSRMAKNVSYKWRRPDIHYFEHTHLYHSINDQTMQPNKYSNATGGHFHEVTIEYTMVDGEKAIKGVKIGPPMMMVAKKVANGEVIKRPGPVEWETFDKNGELTTIRDTHTHDFEFLGTEIFSIRSKTAMRNEEREKVRSAMEPGAVSTQPGLMQGLVNNPEADKVKHLLKEGAESTEPKG